MLDRSRLIVANLLLICLGISSTTAAAPKPSASSLKPKLVIAIIIDQFRYDYLTRFRSDYHGGLNQMMTEGADFTNAFYAQVPTVTAVGHSIFMSGAMPAVSGIVGNSWYDREQNQIVTSVCDWDVKTIGGNQADQGSKCTDADPASPKRLLVSTLGDELRDAHTDSKVIGISIKARGAILPSGHRAAAAYWFDDVSGHFVSSSFYVNELPSWANAFNDRKLPAKYVDQRWEGFPFWDFRPEEGSKAPYDKLPASPWGNELIEQFAENAIAGEKLGQGTSTDLLTISFSSNDYVGHQVGPDAPEVRDMAIRSDQLLAKLFRFVDGKVGLRNTIVVLSADHGVAATGFKSVTNNMPGGYLSASPEVTASGALTGHFGRAQWIVPGAGDTSLYFNWNAIRDKESADEKVLPKEDIYRVAKEALLADRDLHIARIYTREELERGIPGDFIARAEMNGFFSRRSGDLAIVYDPGYVPGQSGTTHFSPYAYDRHVPVLFMGPGIKWGRYDNTIEPNDIAPTLATMLDVQTPSGSSGRVLTEMMVH